MTVCSNFTRQGFSIARREKTSDIKISSLESNLDSNASVFAFKNNPQFKLRQNFTKHSFEYILLYHNWEILRRNDLDEVLRLVNDKIPDADFSLLSYAGNQEKAANLANKALIASPDIESHSWFVVSRAMYLYRLKKLASRIDFLYYYGEQAKFNQNVQYFLAHIALSNSSNSVFFPLTQSGVKEAKPPINGIPSSYLPKSSDRGQVDASSFVLGYGDLTDSQRESLFVPAYLAR